MLKLYYKFNFATEPSYLYRAIDTEGHTLDIWLRKQRDNHSAYAFIKRLIKQFGKPQKVVTDQAPSTKAAMAKIRFCCKVKLIYKVMQKQ